MNKKKSALLCVAGGNIIFGFSFLFSRLALELVPPSVLLAVRFFLAFLVLNLIVIIGRRRISFSLKGKPFKYVLFLAIFQPCVYFICENYGMLYTSTAFAGTILAIVPIMGVVLDVIIMKTKVTRKQAVCAGVSVLGVCITSLGGEYKASAAGILILLGAVLAASLFYVFSKKSGNYFNSLEQTYVMFGMGSIVYIFIAAVQCHNSIAAVGDAFTQPVFWIATCYLAVLSSVCAFLLINHGNQSVTVSESSLLVNLTTIISIVAGVMFLHESFTIQQIVGAILILISVYVSGSEKNR